MSVPKAKKKNNCFKKLTMRDLEKAQREVDREYAKLELEAAQDATRTVSALYCIALHNLYNFASNEFAEITEETHKICDRIRSGEYSWDGVYDDLEALGITRKMAIDGWDSK